MKHFGFNFSWIKWLWNPALIVVYSPRIRCLCLVASLYVYLYNRARICQGAPVGSHGRILVRLHPSYPPHCSHHTHMSCTPQNVWIRPVEKEQLVVFNLCLRIRVLAWLLPFLVNMMLQPHENARQNKEQLRDKGQTDWVVYYTHHANSCSTRPEPQTQLAITLNSFIFSQCFLKLFGEEKDF